MSLLARRSNQETVSSRLSEIPVSKIKWTVIGEDTHCQLLAYTYTRTHVHVHTHTPSESIATVLVPVVITTHLLGNDIFYLAELSSVT